MYIDVSKLDYCHDERKSHWKFFEITLQDFHRNRRDSTALIIDHPGINALYEEFAYLRNGKLNLLVPEPGTAEPVHHVVSFRYWGRADGRENPWALSGDSFNYWHWDNCFLTDSELKMLLYLRYPGFCQNEEEEKTVMTDIRNYEYRGDYFSDGLLKPNLDLPAPYNDILYKNFSEPWAPITFE